MFDDEPVGGACNDPNGGSASVVPVTDHNGAAGAAVAVIANADGQPGRYTQANLYRTLSETASLDGVITLTVSTLVPIGSGTLGPEIQIASNTLHGKPAGFVHNDIAAVRLNVQSGTLEFWTGDAPAQWEPIGPMTVTRGAWITIKLRANFDTRTYASINFEGSVNSSIDMSGRTLGRRAQLWLHDSATVSVESANRQDHGCPANGGPFGPGTVLYDDLQVSQDRR